MSKYIEEKLEEISENFLKLKKLAPVIYVVAQECINSLKNGNKILFCGNGGSAADSQHLASELVGKYKINRPAMASIALTTDTSVLTSLANDSGYDTIFERQVQALGQSGDILIGLSTSGNSQNVVKAFKMAKKMGIKTVAMTGNAGGMLKEFADYVINVPSEITNNIQEMHIAVGHLICEIVEKAINE